MSEEVQKKMAKYYNQSEAYFKRISEKDGTCFDGYLGFIKQYVHEPTGRFLDIGCGGGMSSWRIACAFPEMEVSGIDLSEKSIEHARKSFSRANLTYEVMDACDLKIPNMSVDVIASNDVIEHIPDVQKHLSECDRILKHHGCLLVLAPNMLSPFVPLYQPLVGRKWHGRKLTLLQGIMETVRLFRFYLTKRFQSVPTFTYRTPILDDAIHTGDDADAVFVCNPFDLMAYFNAKGSYEILNATRSTGITRKQRVLRLINKYWAPVGLVVQKKG